MKILYANVSTPWTVKGHRLFDVEWADALSEIADVDLLSYFNGWYDNVPEYIHEIYFDPDDEMPYKQIITSKVFTNRVCRHLCIYEHIYAKKILDFIEKINEIRNYNIIIISTLDTVTFAYTYKRYKWIDKMYKIEHFIGAYQKLIYIYWFNKYKNKINHIIMEKEALKFYKVNQNVKADRLVYIPHPLTKVNHNVSIPPDRFDIVGISNSNSEELVKQIVEQEKRTHFFEKQKLRILLRTKNFQYDNFWIKVIAGRVNLSHDEYYAYISNAKIILMPYDFKFGLHSSGTLSDAFAHYIPVIGTSFDALKIYSVEFPHICKTVESLDQIYDLIIQTLVEKDDEIYRKEFEEFINDRSKEGLVKYFRAFVP